MRKSAIVNVVRDLRTRSNTMPSITACALGEQSPWVGVSTQPPLNGL